MSLAPFRRLPSQLFREKQLVPDQSQEAALSVLDSTARALASYVTTRRRYTVVRTHVEKIVSVEAERLRAAERSGGYAWRLLKAAVGRSTEARLQEFEATVSARERCPPRPDPPRGVYLCGDVGTGKTTLMHALQTSASYSCPVGSVVKIHYASLIQWMHQRLHDFDCQSEAEREKLGWTHPLDAMLPSASRKPGSAFTYNKRGIFSSAIAQGTGGLFCLDEFQLADVADARLLQGCLSRVMEHGFSIAMTSNRLAHEHNPHFLHNAGYMSFLDFLDERCAVQEVGRAGENLHSHVDYRERLFMAREPSAKVIFPSSDPASERNLRDCWRDETGCEWDEVVQMNVRVSMGRTFVVARASPSSSAAQLAQDELLYSAVGPADFEALAKRFKVIFITDSVPPINKCSRDVAQRWIWLIDALYNQGARLAMRISSGSISDAFSADELVGRDRSAVAEGQEFESERAKLTGQAAANDQHPAKPANVLTSLYTDEGERFALRRAASRLLEMQTDLYTKRRGSVALNCWDSY